MNYEMSALHSRKEKSCFIVKLSNKELIITHNLVIHLMILIRKILCDLSPLIRSFTEVKIGGKYISVGVEKLKLPMASSFGPGPLQDVGVGKQDLPGPILMPRRPLAIEDLAV